MEQLASEIFRYLKIVGKRRYLFIGVSLAMMTLFIGGSYLITPKYKADSTVFIESNVINSLVKGLAVTPEMTDRIRVLKYALLSRDTISKVVRALRPDPISKTRLQELVADLQQRTEIRVNGNDLFTVSVTDRDPHFAQNYINTLISTYVSDSLTGKRNETAGANKFLNQQLEQFKQKLDQAEDNIIAFRKSQGVFLAADEKTLLDNVADYRKQIEEIDLKVTELNARKKELQSQFKTLKPTVAVVSKNSETSIPQLEARLSQLLVSYTENYPEVVKVRNDLSELKKNLAKDGQSDSVHELETINPVYQKTQQGIFDTEAEISALQGKKTTLLRLMKQREDELKQVPESQKKLAALIQERDSYRKINDDLMMRLSQSEVSKQMEIGDKAKTFRVVDAALLPIAPVSPNMSRMILLSILAGLGCGVVAALLRENLDHSVKDVLELRDLGLEVLAVVPGIIDERLVSLRKRKDRFLYGLSGLYFCGVLGLLVLELFRRLELK